MKKDKRFPYLDARAGV